MATATPKLKVITPEGVLSYPHLFVAAAGPDGGTAKFSATLLFAKGADLKEMKAAAQAAGEKKYGAEFVAGVRAGKYKWPFRVDDPDKKYPEGTVRVAARSNDKPQIVSRFKGPDDKAIRITEADQSTGNPGEMYPGCLVRASITAYAYDKAGNKGVAFALNNVQKLGDGPRLDSKRAAQDEFEADLSETPASLDDVTGAASGGPTGGLKDLL